MTVLPPYTKVKLTDGRLGTTVPAPLGHRTPPIDKVWVAIESHDPYAYRSDLLDRAHVEPADPGFRVYSVIHVAQFVRASTSAEAREKASEALGSDVSIYLDEYESTKVEIIGHEEVKG